MSEALRELFKDEIEEEIAERKMQVAIEIATRMLEADYEPEMVASLTGLDLDKVEELAGRNTDV